MSTSPYIGHMKILLVEDVSELAMSLSTFLRGHSIDVEVEGSGPEALSKLQDHQFDALILDWLLPGLNGIEIIKWLREHGDATPILMLTAQSGLQHRILGLEEGADDYLTKPFHPEELLARLRALIRRSQRPVVPQYHAGEYVFLPLEHILTMGDASVELSQRESDILLLLFQELGNTVGRRKLLQQVWGYDFDPKTNVVEVYIRMLRNKIAALGGRELIITRRGVGYTIATENT